MDSLFCGKAKSVLYATGINSIADFSNPNILTNQKYCTHFVCTVFLVGDDGFEPSKSKQQIYSLPPLAAREISPIKNAVDKWSWWTDSNPRPADYKSAALPTELHQHNFNSFYIIYHSSAFVNTFFEKI